MEIDGNQIIIKGDLMIEHLNEMKDKITEHLEEIRVIDVRQVKAIDFLGLQFLLFLKYHCKRAEIIYPKKHRVLDRIEKERILL